MPFDIGSLFGGGNLNAQQARVLAGQAPNPAPNPNPQVAPGGPPSPQDAQGAAPGGGQPNVAAAAPGQTPSQTYAPDPQNGQLTNQMLLRAYQHDQFMNSLSYDLRRVGASFGTAQQQASSMAALGSPPQENTLSALGDIQKIQQQQTAQSEHARFIAGADLMGQQIFNLKPGQGAWMANNPDLWNSMVTAHFADTKLSDQEKVIRDWEASARASGMSDADIQQQKTMLLGGTIGGQDPAQKDMNHDRMVWASQNPGTAPPSYLTNVEEYKLHVQGETAKTKEVTATQGNFQGAKQGYDQQIQNVNELMDPKNKAALDELTGWYNSTVKLGLAPGTLSPNAQRIKRVYDTVMASQFSSAVQDFPGSRISTKELVADAPSKSTMGLQQNTDDLLKATADYRDQILNHRANLFGKAHQLDDSSLSDAEYDKYVSQIYKPGGDLGPKTAQPRTPVSIRSPMEADALPAGKAFVLPDGTKGYSVHNESDIALLPKGAKFVVPDGSGRIGTAQ